MQFHLLLEEMPGSPRALPVDLYKFIVPAFVTIYLMQPLVGSVAVSVAPPMLRKSKLFLKNKYTSGAQVRRIDHYDCYGNSGNL